MKKPEVVVFNSNNRENYNYKEDKPDVVDRPPRFSCKSKTMYNMEKHTHRNSVLF